MQLRPGQILCVTRADMECLSIMLAMLKDPVRREAILMPRLNESQVWLFDFLTSDNPVNKSVPSRERLYEEHWDGIAQIVVYAHEPQELPLPKTTTTGATESVAVEPYHTDPLATLAPGFYNY